ncbi:MAG: integrase arm-type DNA-binding domain-containing protein, partial [Kangiellaceae bacterium]|nr:integrase arm-type DNA-binding domain-containing protein [Kangiellaceae bacterium]
MERVTLAKSTLPLTDTQIKKAKAKEKEYSLGDGQGLLLRLMPNGSKRWLFNYQTPFDRRRTNIEIGRYPEVTLKRAREIRAEYRQLLSENINPKDHREKLEQESKEALDTTFMLIAKKQLETKRGHVTDDHLEKIERSLEKYIYPKLGKKPISALRAPDFIKVLRPIEAKGTLETVSRLIQRINSVMDYAVNYGLIEQNPTSAIKQVFRPPTKKHYPTLEPEQLPKLIRSIATANISRQTRCLIEWQL